MKLCVIKSKLYGIVIKPWNDVRFVYVQGLNRNSIGQWEKCLSLARPHAHMP